MPNEELDSQKDKLEALGKNMSALLEAFKTWIMSNNTHSTWSEVAEAAKKLEEAMLLEQRIRRIRQRGGEMASQTPIRTNWSDESVVFVPGGTRDHG